MSAPDPAVKKSSPKKQKEKKWGLHEFIEHHFVDPTSGAGSLKQRKFWKDGSNFMIGRGVAGGLRQIVEEGVRPKSKAARAIANFLRDAGYQLSVVEAPIFNGKLRCSSRIDLVAYKDETEFVIEIKVAAANGWNKPISNKNMLHVGCPDTPRNRAWIQAAVGAAMYVSSSSTVVRPRVLHLFQRQSGTGFVVRMSPEPPWVKKLLLPWVIEKMAAE